MHPPTLSRFRQGSAQRPQGRAKPFALADRVGNPWVLAGGLTLGRAPCLDCYPFPSCRSGQPLAGPVLSGCVAAGHGRGFADAESSGLQTNGFFFMVTGTAVKLTARTTLRGNEPCINTLSSSPLRPPPLRAACRPRPSAALSARLPGLPLQTRWMKTWSLVRLWAVWPGRQPAAFRDCRAAPPIDLTAAEGRRPHQHEGSSGQSARVALFYCASRPGRV